MVDLAAVKQKLDDTPRPSALYIDVELLAAKSREIELLERRISGALEVMNRRYPVGHDAFPVLVEARRWLEGDNDDEEAKETKGESPR